MSESASIKTSIVLPADLHWRLKRTAVEKKLSDTAAVREAIQQWIDGPAPAQTSGKGIPSGDHWHTMLADILASGDREAISAVQQNLLVFHRVKIVKPEHVSPAAVKKRGIR